MNLLLLSGWEFICMVQDVKTPHPALSHIDFNNGRFDLCIQMRHFQLMVENAKQKVAVQFGSSISLVITLSYRPAQCMNRPRWGSCG